MITNDALPVKKRDHMNQKSGEKIQQQKKKKFDASPLAGREYKPK